MLESEVVQRVPPFDAEQLDELMARADLDALVVTSKHNLQYLLGGYRFFFFSHFDAIGISRYQPALVYIRGRADLSLYIGNGMESYERELNSLWVPEVAFSTWTPGDTVKAVATHLGQHRANRIGVERSFLPADAEAALRSSLPESELVESVLVLEELRACKTAAELDLIEAASVGVVDSMLAVIAGHGPGSTKRELVEALRREETLRGLDFEYCLITAGTSLNRAPSDQRWQEGEILSLDSGGNYGGYIGDLCRMAIQGEPDAELEDMLVGIDRVQQAARGPLGPGTTGREIYAAAEAELKRSPHAEYLHFVAHGMGIIAHEAPRLSAKAPVPYPGNYADAPLREGMVLSIETTLPHPRRGFVKLEDTLAITHDGWKAFGDSGRGWNRGGTALEAGPTG